MSSLNAWSLHVRPSVLNLILLSFLKAAHLQCTLILLEQLCFLRKQDLDIQDLFGQILLNLFVSVCVIFWCFLILWVICDNSIMSDL